MNKIAIDARESIFACERIAQYAQKLLRHAVRIDPQWQFCLYGENSQQPILTDDIPQIEYRRLAPNRGLLPWKRKMDDSLATVSLFHSPHYLPFSMRVACPKIVTVHDLHFLATSDEEANQQSEQFKRLAKQVKKIIAASEGIRQQILATFPEIPQDRIVVVANGIEECFITVKFSKFASVHGKKFATDKKYVLLRAAHQPFYGTELSFEAYWQVCKKEPCELIITDLDEVLMDFYSERANALGITEKVHLLPTVSAPEMVVLYNLAEILLYACYSECFSYAIVEAMRCGAKVVAADTATNQEISGGFAELMVPKLPQSFANAIIAKLREARKQQTIREQIKWASQFTWKQTAAKTLAVYKEILEMG